MLLSQARGADYSRVDNQRLSKNPIQLETRGVTLAIVDVGWTSKTKLRLCGSAYREKAVGPEDPES